MRRKVPLPLPKWGREGGEEEEEEASLGLISELFRNLKVEVCSREVLIYLF